MTINPKRPPLSDDDRRKNMWCDYIEFCVFLQDESVMSFADVFQIVYPEIINAEEEKIEQSDRAEQYDRKQSFVESLFDLLKSRQKNMKHMYPFIVESDGGYCISFNSSSEFKSIYLFLLMCSNIGFLEKRKRDYVTKEFEVLSYYILKTLYPSYYTTYIFGTSRMESVFTGTTKERVAKLAEMLGLTATNSFMSESRYDVYSGDAGIDLVSFAKIDSGCKIPVVFAQCACSKEEWESKQRSISRNQWTGKIENVIPFTEIMFVPFSWRKADGKVYDPTSIETILIDRFRIVLLFGKIPDFQKYYENLSEILKQQFGEILPL